MKNVINILEDLIEINSSNPPGNERYMVDYILSYFQGYENVKVISHGEGRASLIIEITGESDEVLAIIGHLDTVPVANLNNWKYDPFKPKIADNIMYGRGTSDMKSGLACMINTAKYFIYNNTTPQKTVRFMFTADEECNGIGIRSLIELGYFDDVKYLLIPETSSESIVLKEKGALWLKLKVYGKPSHGSTPELGINAIEKVCELIHYIRPLINNGEIDELLGKNSIAINKINGGTKTNITADYCEAEIDIRTIPSLKHDTILKSIKETIKKMESDYSELRIDLEIINNRVPMMTDENNELMNKIKYVMNDLGYNFNIKGVNFFTDGSIVLSKYDIPFVIYGPGEINQCHVDNEYVSLDSLERVSKVYIELLKENAI